MEVFVVPRDKLNPSRTRNPVLWVMTASFVAFLALTLLSVFAWEELDSSLSLRRAVAFSMIALLFLVIGTGLVAGWKQNTRKILDRWREEGRYQMSDNALIRHLPGEPDIVIRFDEIVGITESPSWLTVRATTGWHLSIPREVARYEELRSTLARHSSITPAERSAAPLLIAIAANAVIIISLVLLIETKERSVRDTAASLLIGTLTWQYVIWPLWSLRHRTRA